MERHFHQRSNAARVGIYSFLQLVIDILREFHTLLARELHAIVGPSQAQNLRRNSGFVHIFQSLSLQIHSTAHGISQRWVPQRSERILRPRGLLSECVILTAQSLANTMFYKRFIRFMRSPCPCLCLAVKDRHTTKFSGRTSVVLQASCLSPFPIAYHILDTEKLLLCVP